MKIKNLAAIAVLAMPMLGSAFSVQAATFTTIELPTLTANLTTWSDGTAYTSLFPTAPASGISTLTTTLGGVSFALSTDSSGNVAYNSSASSLVLPTDVFGATTVYTLINTSWGSAGADVGQITFNATNNTSYTVELIEGGNVRDHYYGSYINYTTDPTTTQAVFGINAGSHAHLDMQAFALPSSFANETLTSIVFTSYGLSGTQGQPFIAGATVSVVPIPASFSLLLSGLGLLGSVARRKQKRVI